MAFKYTLLLAWAAGLVLLISGLYLKDTAFKKKKICKLLSIIGGTIVIGALTAIFIYFISQLSR